MNKKTKKILIWSVISIGIIWGPFVALKSKVELNSTISGKNETVNHAAIVSGVGAAFVTKKDEHRYNDLIDLNNFGIFFNYKDLEYKKTHFEITSRKSRTVNLVFYSWSSGSLQGVYSINGMKYFIEIDAESSSWGLGSYSARKHKMESKIKEQLDKLCSKIDKQAW